MLKSTFLHIPAVGKSTEEFLWQRGVLTWEDFLSRCSELGLSHSKEDALTSNVQFSIDAHQSGNHSFFSARLPQKEHWRAYPDFRNVCFLDIETTGLSQYYNDITMIGIYDGKESQFFIKDKNMSEFPAAMERFSTIVTFNGRTFDLPFIQAKFPELRFEQLHIDLRYPFARLGFKGGLKKIEPQLGLVRAEEVQGIDGFEAVRLWRRYMRGDKSALDTLVAYNKEDIENLKPLADFAYSHLKEKEFLEANAKILEN